MVFSEDYDFKNVFKFCYSPGVVASPNSGHSPGAVKKSKQVMSDGKIAICLSASNGVEWMSIYANEILKEKIYHLAYELYGSRPVDLIKSDIKHNGVLLI